MISNAPLERLINAVTAFDGLAAGADHDAELRCLMRKIEWVAEEAETAVHHCAASAPAVPAGFKNAA